MDASRPRHHERAPEPGRSADAQAADAAPADAGPGDARPAEHEPTPTERRQMTAAEARALAHPMRLRILFACRARERTNKELAQLLDTTPGTIHYHLKPLVEEGFLRLEQPRPGPRGSTEQPYRSTGKSWQVSGHDAESGRALREVGATEVLHLDDEQEIDLSRLGLTLSDAEVDELNQRIRAVIEEFAARSRTRPGAGDGAEEGAERSGDEDDTEGMTDVTLFYALYHSIYPTGADPEPPASS